MANPTVTFNLEQIEITVQCLKTETMRTIIQRFETKIQQSADSFMYLYSGGQVNMDLTFEQQANHLDRENNQMKILVYKTESNGFKCPYCAKKIKLGEDLDDILKAYNNLKETINGIKSMLENIIKTSINNPINNQLKIDDDEKNSYENNAKLNNHPRIGDIGFVCIRLQERLARERHYPFTNRNHSHHGFMRRRIHLHNG